MTTVNLGRTRGGARTPKMIINQKKSSLNKTELLAFPSDLGTHQFLMQFVKYNFDPNSTTSEDTELSVAFPVPSTGMTDSNSVRYNSTELGLVGGAVAMGGGAMAQQFGAGKSDKPKNIDYNGLAKSALTGLAAAARSLAPGEIGGAVDLALGNIVNPHVALLFQGVNMKQFTFTWKFAPASRAESDTLKDIINKIKSKVYPRTSSTENNFFLTFPHEVDLFYVGSNDYMHYFKRCACQDITVDYQVEGPAFMAGTGAPAFVNISMQFMETEIWTGDEFDSSIGENSV
jgi:hypothetical protein